MIRLPTSKSTIIKLINKNYNKLFSTNAKLKLYSFKLLPTTANKVELFQSPIPKSVLNLDTGIIEDWKFGLNHIQTVIKGKVYGWGNNDYGQVGPVNTSFSTGLNIDDSDEFIETPFLCPSLENLETRQVACGYYHNYSLATDGTLLSWGAGILGKGNEIYDPNPQKVTFFEEIQTKINDVYATGNYSLASVSPIQNPERRLIYGWGYLPPLANNSNYKAIHPILIKPPNFSSQNQINVSTQENGFWISTKSLNSTKWKLHWFGKSSPDTTLERPYYPTYDESSNAITSLNNWLPEIELNININILDKVHLIGNYIVTKDESSNELMFFDSIAKNQLEGIKVPKVKDWGYLGSNLFVVFSLENELQLYSINDSKLHLIDEKLILSRAQKLVCQHGQVLLK